MVKSKKQEEKPESEEAIMERTKEALRRALNTPHETHKEMVERRRGVDPERKARRLASKRAKT